MSTSLEQKIAESFMSQFNSHEKVLIAIEIPKLANHLNYLWDQ
jgi:hypothetical protein